MFTPTPARELTQITGVELNRYIMTRVDEITDHSLSRALKGLLVHNATAVSYTHLTLPTIA